MANVCSKKNLIDLIECGSRFCLPFPNEINRILKTFCRPRQVMHNIKLTKFTTVKTKQPVAQPHFLLCNIIRCVFFPLNTQISYPFTVPTMNLITLQPCIANNKSHPYAVSCVVVLLLQDYIGNHLSFCLLTSLILLIFLS